MFLCLAFVLFPVNLFGIGFFDCPLAVSVLSWLQSLLFYSSPLSRTILVHHVLSGFSSGALRVVPRVFVYHVNICKFCIGWAQNDYRFCRVPPSVLIVMDRVKRRLVFASISRCSPVVSLQVVVVASSSVSGVLVVTLLRSSMAVRFVLHIWFPQSYQRSALE